MSPKRWIINESRTSEYIVEAPDTMSRELIESWARDQDSHELFLPEDLFEGIDRVTIEEDNSRAEDAFTDVEIDARGEIVGGEKVRHLAKE